MYFLAAHIISHLAGTLFQTYITCNIIAPLSMNSTTYNISVAEQFGTVADVFVDTGVGEVMENGDQKRRFKPVLFWNKNGGDDLIAGAGGVISNAKDMVCALDKNCPEVSDEHRTWYSSGNMAANPTFEREVS